MGTSKSYLVHATGVEGQPIRLEVRASSATQAKAKFKKMVDETVSNVMAESMANRAGKEPTPEVKAALKHIAYAALGGPINRVPSAYAWLVVDPDGNVWAGNEYKQDAMDAFREIRKLLPYGSKVMSKATYKRMKGTANRSGGQPQYRLFGPTSVIPYWHFVRIGYADAAPLNGGTSEMRYFDTREQAVAHADMTGWTVQDNGVATRTHEPKMVSARQYDKKVRSLGSKPRNRAGKVGGVKLVKHPKHKHLRTSKDGRVSAGRVHADRFYALDELPLDVQRDNDWASEDTPFVRMKYGTGKSARYEFIPMENFQNVSGGKAPSGRPVDGFAGDSYFSGTALKLIPGGEGSDHEYQVWMESW